MALQTTGGLEPPGPALPSPAKRAHSDDGTASSDTASGEPGAGRKKRRSRKHRPPSNLAVCLLGRWARCWLCSRAAMPPPGHQVAPHAQHGLPAPLPCIRPVSWRGAGSSRRTSGAARTACRSAPSTLTCWGTLPSLRPGGRPACSRCRSRSLPAMPSRWWARQPRPQLPCPRSWKLRGGWHPQGPHRRSGGAAPQRACAAWQTQTCNSRPIGAAARRSRPHQARADNLPLLSQLSEREPVGRVPALQQPLPSTVPQPGPVAGPSGSRLSVRIAAPSPTAPLPPPPAAPPPPAPAPPALCPDGFDDDADRQDYELYKYLLYGCHLGRGVM